VRTNAVLATRRDTAHIEGVAAAALAAALAADAKAAQEIIDRQAADAILAAELAVARSQIGDIMQADVHDPAKAYPSGDLVQFGDPAKLYRALQDVPVGIAITNAAYWEVIGNYASLGEAVSATAALSTATASELESVSQTVTRHEARMPAGTDTLANEARVLAAQQAAASATGAVASDLDLLEIKVNDPATGLAAKASITQHNQVKGRIDNTGGGRSIEQVAGALVIVENALPGKADATAYSSLNTYTRTTLAGEVQANALAATKVSAQLGQVGENAIRKGVFTADQGKGMWPAAWSVAVGSGHASGCHLAVNSGGYEGGVSDAFATAPGEVFDLSADSYGGAMTSGSSAFGLQFLDSAGANLSQPAPVVTLAGQGWQLNKQGLVTAPAGAVRARGVIFYSGSAGGRAEWQNLKAIRRTAQVASLSTASQTMRADVDSVTGKVNSSYTLAMNANGKFSGVKFGNDGTVSNAEFLFDNFDFITADGSFQITGGRTITRSGGYMTVVGKVFGQTNEFVEWYGPNQTNLANCTRANAISYKTNSGITFSRGGFIGGTRVTSGFNPSLAVPVTFNSGVFGTGGAHIAVNGTYSYYKSDTTSSLSGRFTAGSGTTSASIQLWRKIGAGAWAMVASQAVTGTLEIQKPGDASDTAIWQMNGAINYIDTAGGTANREYELRLISRSLQSVTHNGQGTVIVTQQEQSTGVATIE
jgi:hypothetical protein